MSTSPERVDQITRDAMSATLRDGRNVFSRDELRHTVRTAVEAALAAPVTISAADVTVTEGPDQATGQTASANTSPAPAGSDTTTLHVLTVDHRYGSTTTLHRSAEDAEDAARAWVREHWDTEVGEDEPMSEDGPDEEDVEMYFDKAQEGYTITEATLPAA